MAESTFTPSLTPMGRLMRLLRQYRREIRYILLYAIVSGLISLSLPLGVQAIIGLIAGGSISASWGVLVLIVIVGAPLAGFLRFMQLSIMEYLQRKLFVDAAMDFALRIPRLNLEILRKEHLPELVNRFFDTMNLQKGLPKLLIEGTTSSITVILSLTLLSFYHPTFVSFSLLLIFVLSVLFYWTGPRGLQTSLTESKYKYRLAYWLEEVGRVAATFKLAGDNRFPVIKADELTARYLDARAKHWRILQSQFFGGLAFRILTLGGFLILGSLLVMENELNIGQFVASEILVLFVIDSIEKLILLHETAYDVLTATEKLGQVTDLPIEEEGGIRTEEICHGEPLGIELRNLSYQYDDGDHPILNNLNLVINPGDRIAITGYTGAGKSTLMQILSAIKREFTGTLLFNNLPAQNLDVRSLRNHIGDFSSQEDIFKGSILENITLGNEKVSVQQALLACNEVGLSDAINEMPNGLETEVLPGGRNLPGGFISKLLNARAIVANPKFLALEEPLVNLNFRDRLRIAQLLTDKSKSWTLICSTEDPLLASMCDRVLVLQHGNIVFDGKFDDLQKTEHGNKIFRFNLPE